MKKIKPECTICSGYDKCVYRLNKGKIVRCPFFRVGKKGKILPLE
jgi:hypothetical protein